MKIYTLKEHFVELKSRLAKIVFLFLFFSGVSYYFSDSIYNVALRPLADAGGVGKERAVIYTGLAEAFFTYLKLACFCGFCFTFPFIMTQIYLFMRSGLYENEKKIVGIILFFSPILFLISIFFVYYLVIPNAWRFFLSFESSDTVVPIILEAKINEYLGLVMQLIIAFGLAFQLPIIVLSLNLLNVVKLESLRKGRRFSILINFIIAGIVTPPDVLSQFALAIPMILLYEASLIACKFLEKGRGRSC